MTDDGLSIQEELNPDLTCFGCGPKNGGGLRLRSFADNGRVTATFVPWPEHDNGLGYLNGGIISTVLDCHSAAAVILEAQRRGWASSEDAALPYVTACLDVRFLRPTPLTEPLELVAAITAADEGAMTANVELRWADKPRATTLAHWQRWRAREPRASH